jgi:hypothetical protein
MSDFLAIRGVQVRRHEWLGSMPFRQDPWCILSAPCAALDVRVAQRYSCAPLDPSEFWIERIADLLDCDLLRVGSTLPVPASGLESTR